MQARVGAIALLLAALAVPGCARWRSRAPLDYRTIRADPNHDSEQARSENQRAIALLEKGKSEKAEQALQKALIADVTYGPAHNNLGNLYFTQGKYYLAAWEFEYAAKLMPHRAECHNNLGLVYEAVGKLDEAIDAYTLAYGIDAKNPIITGNLARARIRRGDVDPVIQQLLADLRLYDTRPDWRRWADERLALGPPPATETDPVPRPLRPRPLDRETTGGTLGESISMPVPDADPTDELPWPKTTGDNSELSDPSPDFPNVDMRGDEE